LGVAHPSSPAAFVTIREGKAPAELELPGTMGSTLVEREPP
jgi:hypothetical protein